MSKFFDWMFGEERPQARIEVEKSKEPKVKKERGSFATSPADIEASKAAKKAWEQREKAAYDAFVPKEPAFKIVQVPAGHFLILRRYTQRANDIGFGLWTYDYHPWADEIDKWPVGPYDAYETVKNTDAPIMTKEYGSFRYTYGNEYRLTGYADLAFNVFEDAEAYLFRMAQPQDCEVGYDFPPLKKRAKPTVKKAKATGTPQ